jgi:hypothetical protein
LNAGGAMYLLSEAKIEQRKKTLFIIAALSSIALKLVLAGQWSDYDVGSYDVVATLVLHGKSVYANTERYNYAPLWALFLAGLKQISVLLQPLRLRSFHLCIAAFLAMADVALAAILAAKYRYGAGIFFLCCPVTILLTGSYSQFDNLSLLAGFAAWLLVREGSADWTHIVASAGLLGLSLVIKQVFFLFPLWLLVWSKLGSLRKRLAYAAIAYGVFGLSFLPWSADPASRAGIYQHVFLYRSRLYFSVLHLLAASHHFWLVSRTETSILTLIWMVALMAAGMKVSRSEGELFPMYLLVMVACSPALNDYYLALTMLACAIFYPRWPIWALISTATLALYTSPGGIFDCPFSRLYYLSMLSSQISAGALFLVEQRRAGRSDAIAVSVQDTARKALTLAVGSMAAMLLLLLIKAWTLGLPSSTWILPTDSG